MTMHRHTVRQPLLFARPIHLSPMKTERLSPAPTSFLETP